MDRIVVKRRVDGDGILEVTLRPGANEAVRDMMVTVEPANPERNTSL